MKRIVCFAMVGFISSQSMAFQQFDRTAGLTATAVVQAQANLKALRSNILELDLALESTAKEIQERDRSGNFLNKASVAGAALGVGLSLVSMFALESKSPKAGVASLVLAVGASMSTLVSSLTGSGSLLQQKSLDTELAHKELENLEAEIQINLRGQDGSTKLALEQLLKGVTDLKSTVLDHQEQEDRLDNVKYYSQIGQVLGTAMFIIAMTQPNTAGKFGFGGVLLVSTSNILRIHAGMTDSQAEQVLKEIASVRESLKSYVTTL